MSPRALIPFATVNKAPGTSICVNLFGWPRSPAACIADESEKQPSTSRIVVNGMFSLFIRSFLCYLAFFDAEIVRDQFWPFTGVLREIGRAVMHKVLKAPQITRMLRMSAVGAAVSAALC